MSVSGDDRKCGVRPQTDAIDPEGPSSDGHNLTECEKVFLSPSTVFLCGVDHRRIRALRANLPVLISGYRLHHRAEPKLQF